LDLEVQNIDEDVQLYLPLKAGPNTLDACHSELHGALKNLLQKAVQELDELNSDMTVLQRGLSQKADFSEVNELRSRLVDLENVTDDKMDHMLFSEVH